MERVETLLKKLQDQFEQKANPHQLLLTVQMLQAELLQVQGNGGGFGAVAVTLAQHAPAVNGAAPVVAPPPAPVAEEKEEEKIVEILQVDEAEIDAELEEIKRNAEALQKISHQNKPHIVFEQEEEVPTLTKQDNYHKQESKKEINETVTGSNGASLNEKLKQSRIDLGDTLTEAPIRDLKKAIGVNDRFLFINELFRGDEAVYERSIKTINSFSILPEAEYWIQRELKVKNGWNDSNPVVRQFDQLVKRRFA